jgi:hypothetical protein
MTDDKEGFYQIGVIRGLLLLLPQRSYQRSAFSFQQK